jgi:outer membrane biosynthesis protein TonB
VSVRLTGALVAAFALLAVLPSVAAADLSRGAQRVYDDYRNDAALTPCDHSIKTYRRTLREITSDIEEEAPAFRPAVEAALRERESGKQPCAAPGSGEQDQNAAPGGTNGSTPASPPASVQPAQPAKPAPAKPAKPAQPAQPAQPVPAQPAKPAPSATPTPTVAPAAPVTSPTPAPASAPVLLDRPHHGTPVGLLIALGLLALCLLAVPLALLARRFDRFPGARHAWGEAAYRAGGTWTDFLDWARAGR